MGSRVYREFSRDDLLHTTVRANPSVVVESSSAGWSGNSGAPSGSLSLYSGVRSRADVGPSSTGSVRVYPIDELDTRSVDKVIGVPGEYPQTGSIRLAYVTNDERPTALAVTDTRWHEEHWSAVSILSDWYNSHRYSHYPALDQLPATMSVLHVPEMFYGRQIASGTVLVYTRAWETASGSNVLPSGTGTIGLSGTRYYVDDGRGRLFDVPAALTGDWQSAWLSGTAYRVGSVFYNEGLIVLTHPSGAWHNELFSASFAASGSSARLHCQFSGSTVLKSMVFMCRLGPGEANASNNPTYYQTDSSGKSWARLSEKKTYVTSIGIYNEERQLVAVAKLAQPIRKRDEDSICVRLRLDI